MGLLDKGKKKPKKNNQGHASCDHPGCGFSTDLPSNLVAHKKIEHNNKF